MIDNARLRETIAKIYGENQQLSRQSANDARALAELKKILEIEGLLSRYGSLFDSTSDNDGTSFKRYPVNDYSGLNSLRARLKGYHVPSRNGASRCELLNESEDEAMDFIDDLFANDDNLDSLSTQANESANVVSDGNYPTIRGTEKDNGNSAEDKSDINSYLSLISSGKRCIGSPILFFFKLGISELTDPSQFVNLDEIARVAKAYGLHIRVTGAADSATGTKEINKGLGSERADFISTQLQNRGIKASLITKINKGGIDMLHPNEANRHCKVELFLLPK